MAKIRERKLVYIPDISKKTWFHWSRVDDASVLRGLTATGGWAADKRWTTARVEKRISKCESKVLCRPAAAINFNENKEFWRQHLRQINIESGLVKDTSRLLARFYNEVTGVWADAAAKKDAKSDPTSALKTIVKKWQSKLDNLNFSTPKINDWDTKTMDGHLGRQENEGIAWQAYLLEACRQDKKLNYLQFALPDASDNDQQIFFAGVEPTFTTPKNKSIIKGIQSRVRPDGLGVTRSGNLVVFEIKGPEDDLGPLSAVIQGVLGALVFQAKRQQLTEVLETPVSLRPGTSVNRRSKITVVVMVSTSTNAHGYAPRLTKLQREIIDHLFDAVDVVERIALVRVNSYVRSCFTKERLANPPTFKVNQYWPHQ